MKTVDAMNDALDAALEMTFPASDPIAVYIADPRDTLEDVRADQDAAAATRVPPATMTMFAMLDTMVSAMWASAATSLALWHAQLQTVRRCGEATRHAWGEGADQSGTSPAPGGRPIPARERPDDPHLLACWRNMYHAATMQEAMNEIKPQVARLLEKSIDDFRTSVAAARRSDRYSNGRAHLHDERCPQA